jgi:hypothetical protein
MPKAVQTFADLPQVYQDQLKQWESTSHSRILEEKEDMALDRLDAVLLLLFVVGLVALAAFAVTMFQTWG